MNKIHQLYLVEKFGKHFTPPEHPFHLLNKTPSLLAYPMPSTEKSIFPSSSECFPKPISLHIRRLLWKHVFDENYFSKLCSNIPITLFPVLFKTAKYKECVKLLFISCCWCYKCWSLGHKRLRNFFLEDLRRATIPRNSGPIRWIWGASCWGPCPRTVASAIEIRFCLKRLFASAEGQVSRIFKPISREVWHDCKYLSWKLFQEIFVLQYLLRFNVLNNAVSFPLFFLPL